LATRKPIAVKPIKKASKMIEPIAGKNLEGRFKIKH
jgi:hypothetical protein